MRQDRIDPVECRADGNPGHAFFHQRHVYDPIAAVFFGKAGGRAENPFEIVDPLPQQQHVGVDPHRAIHHLP